MSQRQVDLYEIEARLVDIVSSRTAKATQKYAVTKYQNNNSNINNDNFFHMNLMMVLYNSVEKLVNISSCGFRSNLLPLGSN